MSEAVARGLQTHLKTTNLDFSYAKGADSVLEVNKADYDACNTKNPIKRVDDGDSEISLDRYGFHQRLSSAMGPSGDGPSAAGDISTPAGAPGQKKSSANGMTVMSITTVLSLVLTIILSA
ncbi:unnamed protein product [Arabidopsis thaliana]|uniref:(thale cress) hypothetical protein n=1 Tax=Arabidopsis thaliana TaxID=3702 RepID=A0A7G2F468_ARATH|nr:unnamed protein product [Arabidopsis thaliana]